MLQDAGERNDLAPAFVDTIADNLVVGIVGRGNALQGTILIGFLDAQVQDVETVIHLEVVAHMAHVQCVEACLGLTECRIHFRGLQHLVRMVGRNTQRLATVHDIFSQSQSQ